MDTACLHPRAGAVESEQSEFGRLASAIDQADAIAGERIGGPTDADIATAQLLWARLYTLSAETADDLRWLCGKLARALMNDGDGESEAGLIRLVGDPLTVGCAV